MNILKTLTVVIVAYTLFIAGRELWRIFWKKAWDLSVRTSRMDGDHFILNRD